ncbi:MAG: hypothetical protein WBA67_01970 [Jannaschia sp.]
MTSDAGFMHFAPVPDWPEVAPRRVVLGVQGRDTGGRLTLDAANGLRRASLALERRDGQGGVDLGDIEADDDPVRAVTSLVMRAQQTGSLPTVIGGDDAVASAVLAAFDGSPAICVAHRLRREVACGDALWLGLNGPQPAALCETIQARGQRFLTARAINAGTQPDWPEAAVLWLDAAALDIGHAAGAIEDNPGGLVPDRIIALMSRWAGPVRAIVVTGAAPARDPRGLSELALAAVCQGVLCHG